MTTARRHTLIQRYKEKERTAEIPSLLPGAPNLKPQTDDFMPSRENISACSQLPEQNIIDFSLKF